jgi:uncharacterized LabA/DUF88 family protein
VTSAYPSFMNRYAVLVDVEYLYAAGGEALLGAVSRLEYRVDAEGLIKALMEHAASQHRGELLRVYWFDAARDRVPTVDQRVIAQLPWVKLRLGNLNQRGQQKGVDAQIRADLEALARHRAVTDAVLIAGDEDILPAVEAAQAYGVRLHLWGVEPPFGTNQAERLVWEADTVETLEASLLKPYFTLDASRTATAKAAGVIAGAPATPTPADVFARVRTRPAARRATTTPHLDRETVMEVGALVAQRWILTRGREHVGDLLPGPFLPVVIDKELLVDAEKELRLSLRAHKEARLWLRDGFWERVDREFRSENIGDSPS